MLKISTETLQKPCRSSPTHEAHNPTNISKATPKTAKVHQKSAKGDPKAPKRHQKNISKATPKTAKVH